jgi:hypothetical protein
VQKRVSLATRTSFARGKGGAQLRQGRCEDSSVVITADRLLDASFRASPETIDRRWYQHWRAWFTIYWLQRQDVSHQKLSHPFGLASIVETSLECKSKENCRTKSNDVRGYMARLSRPFGSPPSNKRSVLATSRVFLQFNVAKVSSWGALERASHSADPGTSEQE